MDLESVRKARGNKHFAFRGMPAGKHRRAEIRVTVRLVGQRLRNRRYAFDDEIFVRRHYGLLGWVRTLRKNRPRRGNGDRRKQDNRRGAHGGPEQRYLEKCAHALHRRNPSGVPARPLPVETRTPLGNRTDVSKCRISVQGKLLQVCEQCQLRAAWPRNHSKPGGYEACWRCAVNRALERQRELPSWTVVKKITSLQNIASD